MRVLSYLLLLLCRLAAKTTHTESDGSKNKGRYLLATKGFDAEKLAQNLHAINLKTTFEPLEPLSETDLEGYLRHEHDMIILTAIQEAKKEVSKSVFKKTK